MLHDSNISRIPVTYLHLHPPGLKVLRGVFPIEYCQEMLKKKEETRKNELICYPKSELDCIDLQGIEFQYPPPSWMLKTEEILKEKGILDFSIHSYRIFSVQDEEILFPWHSDSSYFRSKILSLTLSEGSRKIGFKPNFSYQDRANLMTNPEDKWAEFLDPLKYYEISLEAGDCYEISGLVRSDSWHHAVLSPGVSLIFSGD